MAGKNGCKTAGKCAKHTLSGGFYFLRKNLCQVLFFGLWRGGWVFFDRRKSRELVENGRKNYVN
jgi:hypothetical protein